MASMELEAISAQERVHLLNRWSAYIESGYRGVGDFLAHTFGPDTATRWSGTGIQSPRVADTVVRATVETCIWENQNNGVPFEVFRDVIGHKNISRKMPAFHNYTAEQARTIISKIAQLWVEATDEKSERAVHEFNQAIQHCRNDNLLAYFISLEEDIPLEYAIAAVEGQ